MGEFERRMKSEIKRLMGQGSHNALELEEILEVVEEAKKDLLEGATSKINPNLIIIKKEKFEKWFGGEL